MALVDKGVKVEIPESLLPSDFVPPSYEEIQDVEYERLLVLNVDKSTVQNSDKATTLTNIIENATVGIRKQCTDIVTADYIGTNNVEFSMIFNSLTSNQARSLASEFLTDVASSYVCAVTLNVKTT